MHGCPVVICLSSLNCCSALSIPATRVLQLLLHLIITPVIHYLQHSPTQLGVSTCSRARQPGPIIASSHRQHLLLVLPLQQLKLSALGQQVCPLHRLCTCSCPEPPACAQLRTPCMCCSRTQPICCETGVQIPHMYCLTMPSQPRCSSSAHPLSREALPSRHLCCHAAAGGALQAPATLISTQPSAQQWQQHTS